MGEEAGIFGMGAVTDLGVDIRQAEEEIERKWSRKGVNRIERQEVKKDE